MLPPVETHDLSGGIGVDLGAVIIVIVLDIDIVAVETIGAFQLHR